MFSWAFSSPAPAQKAEPSYAAPRPMTGFFATLTHDQKAKALGYRGPENYGDPELKKA
ncbi:UNVERIFIED_ORG: hypothetical protein GGD48_005857 [Rhizobium etli]